MTVRRSMSQGLSVPDHVMPEIERKFLQEGSLASNKERNITILQNMARENVLQGEMPEEEDIWIPVTFRLPQSLIAELGIFSAQQRAKRKKPWKKQEIIADFLRQGLRNQSNT
jgi:hypothetical protein